MQKILVKNLMYDDWKWHAKKNLPMHTARKSQLRDSYFTLIIRLSVSGIHKNFEESISPLHPTHPSFRDTVISGAPFCAISVRTMRYVQELSWENNGENDVFYWTDISPPLKAPRFIPMLGYPPRTRRDTIKTSLIWSLRRQWGKFWSMKYGPDLDE